MPFHNTKKRRDKVSIDKEVMIKTSEERIRILNTRKGETKYL